MIPASFIVIEGPTGVGVTTCAKQLASALEAGGVEVWPTGEPTSTAFGQMLVDAEAEMTPRAYALAAAADRANHVDHIGQAIEAGQVVISDRYVHSSLVRQRVAGVPLTEIWAYNQRVAVPNLTLYLHVAPEVLEARLAQRGDLDETTDPVRQYALYKQALDFLASRRWPTVGIDCTGCDVDEVTAKALAAVARLER